MSSLVTEQLKQLPNRPGVYFMKDTKGNILYVGKASNLRHRVRSYFNSGQKLSPKLQRLVANLTNLDFIVTGSEQEALILELNLIKKYQPYYNVRLKDDKTYPYLKISTNEDWPRVYVTRSREQDGGRYFGPFTSARSMRQTLKVLKGIFPFRFCTKRITGTDPRPCLDYHVGNCLAPCIGAVSMEEYGELVREIILFLEGKQEKLIQDIKLKMDDASEALDFEKAALFRDQVRAIHKVIEEQRIATRVQGEQDVIAFTQDGDQAYVQVFLIRNSKLIGRESFVLQGTRYEEPPQIMTSFVKQFYDSSTYTPPLLLLQYPVEEMPVIKDWLQDKKGARVDIQVPRRGNKKQLVNLVTENTRRGQEQLKIKQLTTSKQLDAALDEIRKELKLNKLPLYMEAYDISDIRGTAAVGSMVVFEKGKPKPAHYKRFRIKTVAGADDYAMLYEILKRRFNRLKKDDSATGTWAYMPDLILIDGGKGQLNAALAALSETGADFIPVASLAKENEEIFIPHKKEPVALPRSSPSLHLLQRLRDEAHRFALAYFTRVRKKKTFTSALDSVPGIGSKRKRALLRQFGTLQAIKKATVDDLTTTEGMTKKQAKTLKEYL